MATREETIVNMCYSHRHDYGLRITEFERLRNPISSGMTKQEAEELYKKMEKLYDETFKELLSNEPPMD